MPQTTVGIAFTSGYGHTRELANAVAAGVESVLGTTVEMIDIATVTDADWQTLDSCDAIIFGTPPTWAAPPARSMPSPKPPPVGG